MSPSQPPCPDVGLQVVASEFPLTLLIQHDWPKQALLRSGLLCCFLSSYLLCASLSSAWSVHYAWTHGSSTE